MTAVGIVTFAQPTKPEEHDVLAKRREPQRGILAFFFAESYITRYLQNHFIAFISFIPRLRTRLGWLKN